MNPPTTMGIRDVLRIREYRYLFGGQVVSDIGDGITLLLVLLVINDLTGSPAMLALMAIAEAVPAFTIGLVAGVYVDRWNRRRIMLTSDIARAAIVLCFGIVGTPALVPLLFLLGFTQASVATFFRPARGAMLPHIVPREGLPAANSLAQASQIMGGLAGSGLAGLVFGLFGSGMAGFAISATLFMVSFALISRIPSEAGRIHRDAAGAQSQAGVGGSVLEGLRFVRRSRVLSGMIVALAVTMLGLGAVNVLFVPLVVNDLGASPTWMAGINAAQVVGMLAAASFVPLLARRMAPTTIITVGLVGVGLGIGAIAGTTAIWQIMLALVFVGLFVTPLQAMAQTLVQTSTDDASRGRVVSLLQAAMSTASVASMAIGGVAGQVLGIRPVFAAAGLVALAAAGVAWLMFRGAVGGAAPAAVPTESGIA